MIKENNAFLCDLQRHPFSELTPIAISKLRYPVIIGYHGENLLALYPVFDIDA